MTVVQAATMLMPLVKAFMLEADRTGASSSAKHEAVAEAARLQYEALQGTTKELKGIPWELVAPLVVPVQSGLISVLVGLFNRLLGKLWATDPAPALS